MTEFPYQEYSDRELIDLVHLPVSTYTVDDWFQIAQELSIRLETANIMNDIIPHFYDRKHNEEHF